MIDELPDEPRYVEAHAIASDPAGWRAPIAGGGLAFGHDAARLIVACGVPATAAAGLCELAAAHPGHALLAMTAELAAALAAAGRDVGRALLHTLAAPDALPELEGAQPLADAASLDHLPPALARELTAARARGPVWAAWVDGAPVSFAYAPWRSARWFDTSVDTLPGARQLGLGSLVAAALIHDERRAGREPVWGADERNHASRRLAARLGFVEVDAIWVAAPAIAPGTPLA